MIQNVVLFAVIADARTGERVDTRRLADNLQKHFSAALQTAGALTTANTGEYLTVFGNAEAAVHAGIALQRAIEDTPRLTQYKLSLSGRVLVDPWTEEHYDFEAARTLLATQRHSKLLLAAEIKAQLPARITSLCEPHAAPAGATRRWFEVDWSAGEATYREQTRAVQSLDALPACRSLLLSRRDKQLAVNPEQCPLSVGRDRSCGFVVGGDRASRFHSRILHENGRFYYVDESLNGSYVTTLGSKEIFLRNDRIPLSGQGVISLGSALTEQGVEVIRYQCQG